MNNGYTPGVPTGTFDLAFAAAVCTLIEPIAAQHGFHVALTGGCLYGEGGRKDIDIIFYRQRNIPESDLRYKALYDDLEIKLEMVLHEDYGFVKKFTMGDEKIPIDAMFPECVYGDYTLDAITENEITPGQIKDGTAKPFSTRLVEPKWTKDPF